MAPPTGSVLERLELQRQALPEGVRPNARGTADETRAKMYALRFRNRWGARHQRIRPREDMGPAEMRQKVGSGRRKISFMLPGSGLDLRPESGAPVWGRTIRFVLGAGIRRPKTGFGLPAATLGPPCPEGFRSLAMVQFRRLPGAAAEGTTPGQHGRGVAGSTGTQIQNRANPKPLATSATVI